MALDDGEDVVEVVRDTGGKLADGFEFLGVTKLVLQIDALGGVVAVAMDDLAADDGTERPGKSAAIDGELLA